MNFLTKLFWVASGSAVAPCARGLRHRRFRFMQDVPNLARDGARLTVQAATAASEMSELMSLVQQLQDEVLSLRDDLITVPSASAVGSGLLLDLRDFSTGRLAFGELILSPRFRLFPTDYAHLGVPAALPSEATLSGYIVVPRNGTYAFVVDGVNGAFQLFVNEQKVIDQWAAPEEGFLESPAVAFDENAEVSVRAHVRTDGSVAPTMNVMWRQVAGTAAGGGAASEIPTELLFPDYDQPLCASTEADVFRATCETTFQQLLTQSGGQEAGAAGAAPAAGAEDEDVSLAETAVGTEAETNNGGGTAAAATTGGGAAVGAGATTSGAGGFASGIASGVASGAASDAASGSGAASGAVHTFKFQCPPGCAEGVEVGGVQPGLGPFGGPKCYSLESSACLAAIHSGVGGRAAHGSFRAEVRPAERRARYEAAPGLIRSLTGPAGAGCASVTTAVPGSNFASGVAAVALQSVAEFLEAANSTDGARGIITPFAPSVLVLHPAEGKSDPVIEDLIFKCRGELSAGNLDAAAEIDGGPLNIGPDASLSYRLAPANARGLPRLTAAFLHAEKEAMVPIRPLRRSGASRSAGYSWSRLTCSPGDGGAAPVALYFRMEAGVAEQQLPSRTVSCDAHFEDVRVPARGTVVRCPRFCAETSVAPVLGYMSYAPESSICRSAIQAGVISQAGGPVQIRRVDFRSRRGATLPKPEALWAAARFGVASRPSADAASSSFFAAGQESLNLFTVEEPFGNICVYPQHPREGGALQAANFKDLATLNPPRASFATLADSPAAAATAAGNATEAEEPAEEPAETAGMTADELAKELASSPAEALDRVRKFAADARRRVTSRLSVSSIARVVERMQEAVTAQLAHFDREVQGMEAAEAAIFPPSPTFEEFGGAQNIFAQWTVVDAPDAAAGPSAWRSAPKAALRQGSRVASASGAHFGSMLLVNAAPNVPSGFARLRFFVSDTLTGSFGVIFQLRDDRNFNAAVVSLPGLIGRQTLSFRQRVDADGGFLPDVQETTITLAPGWHSLGVLFSEASGAVSAVLDETYVQISAELNETRAAPAAAAVEDEAPGAGVGIFTSDIRSGLAPDGSQAGILFDSFVAGTEEDLEDFSENFFPDRVVLSWLETEGSDAREFAQPAEEQAALAEEAEVSAGQPLDGEEATELIPAPPAAPVETCVTQFDSTASPGPTVWNAVRPELVAFGPEGAWRASGHVRAADNAPAILFFKPELCRSVLTYRVSVEVQLAAEATAGVVARALGQDSYHFAALDAESGEVQLFAVSPKPAVSTKLIGRAFRDRDVDAAEQWVTLAVEDLGSALRVSVNQQPVLQARVPVTASTGAIGLAVRKGSANFRSFAVEPLQLEEP